MNDTSGHVVAKLWSYCHVLRDDGLRCQDYLEPRTIIAAKAGPQPPEVVDRLGDGANTRSDDNPRFPC